MDPLGTNPFAVLTFIAAPAILTNASAVMTLGTSNRFARAIDRARALAKELDADPNPADDLTRLRVKQLGYARRRTLLLVRALTAFYLSLGSFAAGSFTSLLGAVFVVTQADVPRQATMLAAFGCGIVGVGGLVAGSDLLVWESRLALAILADEATLAVRGLPPVEAAGRDGGGRAEA